MSEALHFEDLHVGQSWRSRGRTVTETDVVNFACLTGDFDPLHVDRMAAQNLPFKQPIAHGLLGLSLVAGLGSNSPTIASLAFVTIQKWEFVRPIYFGDTVVVVNEIVELIGKGKRRGHVVWHRRLLNQRDEIVQQGKFETIVACRGSRTATAGKPESTATTPPKPRRRKSKAGGSD